MGTIKKTAFILAAMVLLTSCSYGMFGSDSDVSDNEQSSSIKSEVITDSSSPASSDAQSAEQPDKQPNKNSSEEELPVNSNEDWKLLLVNRAHPLPDDFSVDLAEITGKLHYDSRAVDALNDFLQAAKDDGIKLHVFSAYRYQATQERLYKAEVEKFVNEGYSAADAKEEAAKWVAIPGTSEHQTGLAIDVVSADWNTGDLNDTFDKTAEFSWLIKNCTKYGFVLRFPKDKQEITKITYEPWHYRYVGKENAEYMTKNNLCLEEFAEK